MIAEDLQSLAKFHAPKLDELGDPSDFSHAPKWAKFMSAYPAEFTKLVKMFFVFRCPMMLPAPLRAL